jgi:hypothetical protein
MTSEDATNAYQPDRVSPPGETLLELPSTFSAERDVARPHGPDHATATNRS